MKSSLFFLRCLRVGFPLLALALAAEANTPSDPVGALRLRLRGGSDTLVSLPLQPAAFFECAINNQFGSQYQLVNFIPGLPSGGAYLLVMTGALEGAVLPLTGATTSLLTVDPGPYDLTVLKTENANGTGQGDLVGLVPFWTLDTLFPGGANLYVTTNLASVQSQILVYDDSVAGTNLSPSATYFYYAGDGSYSAGWYRSGDMSATVGSTRLPPNHYFIVRQPVGSADTVLLVTGGVPFASARIPLATVAANQKQDNLVALPIPLPVTLGASLLTDSGAFQPTANLLLVKDELLVFNNAQIGYNKSASAVYLYFAGNTFYPAGWYLFGDMSHTVPSVLLNPGEGYTVRKASTATPESLPWTLLPSYLQ